MAKDRVAEKDGDRKCQSAGECCLGKKKCSASGFPRLEEHQNSRKPLPNGE